VHNKHNGIYITTATITYRDVLEYLWHAGIAILMWAKWIT